MSVPRAAGCRALVALAAACAHGPADRRPAATGPVVVDAQRGYFLLADGSVHFANEGDPAGLHVLGTIEGGRFIPEGDVLGDGPIGLDGSRGWLQLLDGSFYPMQAAGAPLTPYIEGAMTPDGGFSPTSRRVVY